MFRSLVIAALFTVPVAISAQSAPAPQATPTPSGDTAGEVQQAETGQPPKRIRNIAITGNEPCPKAANADEVVVCSRIVEPYRIPKELRDKKPIPPQNQSWVNRAATMDKVGRKAAGLPNTCSNTGSGGQTGCTTEMLRQWAAERAQKKREESTTP